MDHNVSWAVSSSSPSQQTPSNLRNCFHRNPNCPFPEPDISNPRLTIFFLKIRWFLIESAKHNNRQLYYDYLQSRICYFNCSLEQFDLLERNFSHPAVTLNSRQEKESRNERCDCKSFREDHVRNGIVKQDYLIRFWMHNFTWILIKHTSIWRDCSCKMHRDVWAKRACRVDRLWGRKTRLIHSLICKVHHKQ